MPETLAVTLAMTHSGLKRVALVTNGRFSGATDGPCVGHISPEASAGGPIAAPRDGDEITIDIPNRRLDARVDFAARTPQPAPARGIPPGYIVSLTIQAIHRPPEVTVRSTSLL